MEFRNDDVGDVDGELEGNEDTSGSPEPPIYSEVILFSELICRLYQFFVI